MSKDIDFISTNTTDEVDENLIDTNPAIEEIEKNEDSSSTIFMVIGILGVLILVLFMINK